jgi:hypothetical protein
MCIMRQETENKVIGYCYYCANEIKEDDTYVIHRKAEYHKSCFALQFAEGDECGEPR